MTLREYLDSILAFIGSTSLTDVEWADITLTSSEDPYQVYLTLAHVLQTRETVSQMQDRLIYYFAAKGHDFSGSTKGKSNIFLGGSL